jgi:hypothetical protein
MSIKYMREMKSFTIIRYFKWKRSYHHFNMNLLSSFQNQKLWMRKKKGDINGVGPLRTIIEEEKLADFRGRRGTSQKEASGMKYASK